MRHLRRNRRHGATSTPKAELFETAYKDTWSTDNPEGVLPEPEFLLDGKYDLTIPTFLDRVKVISDVVDVDYYVGGCPPHHDFVAKAVEAIVAGNLPPKGSWLTSGKAVCDVCTRNPANKDQARMPVGEIKRPVEGRPDPDKCLLQQGYLCFGPITQGDCGGSCLKVNIPCRGCGGPMPGVRDFGARTISAIGSSLSNEDTARQVGEKYPDLVKLVYRYSRASGTLNKKL